MAITRRCCRGRRERGLIRTPLALLIAASLLSHRCSPGPVRECARSACGHFSIFRTYILVLFSEETTESTAAFHRIVLCAAVSGRGILEGVMSIEGLGRYCAGGVWEAEDPGLKSRLRA